MSANHLSEWLSLLAKHGGGKLLLVPGGGIFADQVRDSQRKWKFDDVTAHKMALLAMEQYGHLMQGLQSQLVAADSQTKIRRILKKKQLPVWLPYKMVSTYCTLPEGWHTSSDSLALWLAKRLQAKHLLIVKSLSHRGRTAAELCDDGLLDNEFPKLLAQTNINVWWLYRGEVATLRSMLINNLAPEGYLQKIRE